jgi:hypothetical protein
MTPDTTNPFHQAKTEFLGELQEFTGVALSPDDPSVEPRVRKGRPKLENVTDCNSANEIDSVGPNHN